MDKIIELSVKNFKAIKEADISLNGITVVTGINGCGKSSLSQLLYYSFYYANRYDDLVDNNLEDSLREYKSVLNLMESMMKGRNTLFLQFVDKQDKKRYLSIIKSLIIRFLQYYEDDIVNTEDKNKISSYNRLVRIIQDILNNDTTDDLKLLLVQLTSDIEKVFGEAALFREERPYSLLNQNLQFYLKNELPEEWEIKEYGVPFASEETTTVPLLHYIKRVAYIDTPMMVGVSHFLVDRMTEKFWWSNLIDLLGKSPVINDDGVSQSVYTALSQIMKGESVLEKDDINTELVYKRNDGKTFDLRECATGIKSFSILQLLLKNGFLQKDTLLIIDEPEAHLHPQWIVEYARMIVILYKEIGVKFFIASHSTDMVSAIRYIAAKEGVQDNLNFYLAEDAEESPYEYTYQELGLDIDPIFESFNKSFDKIDSYGSYE